MYSITNSLKKYYQIRFSCSSDNVFLCIKYLFWIANFYHERVYIPKHPKLERRAFWSRENKFSSVTQYVCNFQLRIEQTHGNISETFA